MERFPTSVLLVVGVNSLLVFVRMICARVSAQWHNSSLTGDAARTQRFAGTAQTNDREKQVFNWTHAKYNTLIYTRLFGKHYNLLYADSNVQM